MAKSLRSKRKKRLRTLRRDIAKPFYDKKETAKLAAQEAALAAPKLPIPTPGPASDALILPAPTTMDVEMTENNPADVGTEFKLKPTGGVKKKMKKASKLKKNKRKKGRRKNRL
ncbi:hypothetical protein EJ110_NYTH09282 [Nymphaea thermarum]|nr:hypothetical protein EJ110_NYTH09282 [Nymphaea thermarum]